MLCFWWVDRTWNWWTTKNRLGLNWKKRGAGSQKRSQCMEVRPSLLRCRIPDYSKLEVPDPAKFNHWKQVWKKTNLKNVVPNRRAGKWRTWKFKDKIAGLENDVLSHNTWDNPKGDTIEIICSKMFSFGADGLHYAPPITAVQLKFGAL